MTVTTSQQITTSGTRRPAVLAWLRLARVFHKMSRRFDEQLRFHGMSVAQFDVLVHVGADPGLTQQELADSLLVTKGNVCQLLDRMEQGRLIDRRQEGRANRLFLTPQGAELFAEIVPQHEELIAGQFDTLSRQEQRELLDLLRKLDQSLESTVCQR